LKIFIRNRIIKNYPQNTKKLKFSKLTHLIGIQIVSMNKNSEEEWERDSADQGEVARTIHNSMTSISEELYPAQLLPYLFPLQLHKWSRKEGRVKVLLFVELRAW
jgi:hypothetical protein